MPADVKHVEEAMFIVLKNRTDIDYQTLRKIVNEQLSAMLTSKEVIRVGGVGAVSSEEKNKLLRIIAAFND